MKMPRLTADVCFTPQRTEIVADLDKVTFVNNDTKESVSIPRLLVPRVQKFLEEYREWCGGASPDPFSGNCDKKLAYLAGGQVLGEAAQV